MIGKQLDVLTRVSLWKEGSNDVACALFYLAPGIGSGVIFTWVFVSLPIPSSITELPRGQTKPGNDSSISSLQSS